MKIDTLGLQAFVAIAEQGGFQKAAETLFITQTALSRRLQNLEALLEVKLVERTTRSVALTVLGAEFLPQCAAPACRLVERVGRDSKDRPGAARRRRDRMRADRRRAVTCRTSSATTRPAIPRTGSRFLTTPHLAWPRL